jgi:glycosyltransferase involved in cell wall biosynthesis
LRGRVDEIVVVDGGSTDASVAIAEAAGARVSIDRGDVAAARNRAFAEATGDWCLMIDADEVVQPETWPAFLEFVRAAHHPKGRILQVSDTAEGVASVWVTRACVRDPRYRYEGSIHEQLVGPGSIGDTGLAVLHSGYRPDVLARKGTSDRNLRLLRAELARKPDDPYLNYQLGKTLLVAGRLADAIAPFALAAEHVSPATGYTSALVCDYGYALKGAARPAEALAVIERFLPHYPDYTDLWFLAGLCHMALGQAREMVSAFERCIALGEAPRYATVRGVGSFRPLYNLGLFYELGGDHAKARECYGRALEAEPSFAPAAERMRRLSAGARL